MIRLVIPAILFCLLSSGFSARVSAQEFADLSLAQLEVQLNAILKTRLDEEREFVSTVIKLVGDGKLPRKLVNVSFKYVLKRRPRAKNRFVYFARVLYFLAAREQVAVPKFDFSIYSASR